MTDPFLRLDHVGKCYRSYVHEAARIAGWFGARVESAEEHWVLRDVSFSVQRGESLGIVGRNGAGKSTLLKIICGTSFPNEGRVKVGGRVGAILELGLGFDPNFTGRQNAVHVARLMGMQRRDIEAAMEDIETFSDIGPAFHQPLHTYSSGMQMRVAFAVSTAFQPDLLIIDEALAVGDLSFQAKCFDRIESLKSRGCAFLFVSHAIDDVVKHCQRALLLDKGRLLLDGPSRDVMNHYLDLLFGGKDRAKTSTSDEGPLEAFPEDLEDHFLQHPNYRKEEYRWGVGGARIVDFVVESQGRLYPETIESLSPMRLSFKTVFQQHCRKPVFGLLIKTYDGVVLYGTNSVLSSPHQQVSPAGAGAVAICEFSLSLPLNEGVYLISLGVSEDTGEGEYLPLDRRYDAILLHVVRDRKFWGVFDFKASVVWKYGSSSRAEGVPQVAGR